MTQLSAEITKTRRVLVSFDIEAYCAANKEDRARFDGTDEDYIRHMLQEVGYDILQDAPFDDEGLHAEEDYDNIDIDVMGVF